ncbi:MAG: hypothetical protein K8I60_01680 [Anaerolineae bacterium]|nr:hypothetical protein [Anaerolineae bacterium]
MTTKHQPLWNRLMLVAALAMTAVIFIPVGVAAVSVPVRLVLALALWGLFIVSARRNPDQDVWGDFYGGRHYEDYRRLK